MAGRPPSTGRRALPALPDLDPTVDAGTARLLAPLKEIVEVREGLRGQPAQRFATLADLLDLGIITAEQLKTHTGK